MLNRLLISNFAIIDHLEVKFGHGLNIITGETGAGKSIMLDALSLALGKRADNSVLTQKDQKCIVEAEFQIKALDLKDFFESFDIDYADETIIRREISPNGRSRAFINDTPTTIQALAQLAGNLIEVHQQFDQLSIREEDFQRTVLDALAGTKNDLKSYRQKYTDWSEKVKQLTSLKDAEAANLKEKDYLEFQINELEELAISSGEEASIEEDINMLSQAEDLGKNLYEISHMLSESDDAILDRMNDISHKLNSSDYGPVKALLERINSTIAEMDDIAREADNLSSQIEADPDRLVELEERLAQIFQLKKKHNVQLADDLIDIQNTLQEQLDQISNQVFSMAALQRAVEELKVALNTQAESISSKRKAVVGKLSKGVTGTLANLGMVNSHFDVDITSREIGPFGKDQIKFMFSSNKGIDPTPIKLSASGGEISRLNLSIKSLIAGKLSLPTMIFDEIDSGVSGEIARRIGMLLADLGNSHQIICITHTPQIASLGQHHLHVSKDSSGDRTTTQIQLLNASERVDVVGQMLGGDPPSEEAKKAAQVLLS